MALGDRTIVWNDSAPMAPVAWASTKIRRVVRSTLAAEAAALATGYGMALYVRTFVGRLLGAPGDDWCQVAAAVPQLTFIDCMSLEQMLHKDGSTPSEKRCPRRRRREVVCCERGGR